jgi:DNA-binding IclR family transcriptional regulator
MGQSYLSQSTLVGRGTPILRALSDAIGETVSLVTLQAGNVQFPISIESKRPVKVAPRIAVSFPAKLNAAGRLLTAQLPDATLAEVLAANTAQDAAIKGQLQELRTSGQIIDRGAIEADVISISRVIRASNNEVVGAVEVLIPQYRAKIDVVLPKVEEAAAQLSAALGATKASLGSAVEKEVVPAQPSQPQIPTAQTPPAGIGSPLTARTTK